MLLSHKKNKLPNYEFVSQPLMEVFQYTHNISQNPSRQFLCPFYEKIDQKLLNLLKYNSFFSLRLLALQENHNHHYIQEHNLPYSPLWIHQSKFYTNAQIQPLENQDPFYNVNLPLPGFLNHTIQIHFHDIKIYWNAIFLLQYFHIHTHVYNQPNGNGIQIIHHRFC